MLKRAFCVCLIGLCLSQAVFAAATPGRSVSRANCPFAMPGVQGTIGFFNESFTYEVGGAHKAYVETHQKLRNSNRLDIGRSSVFGYMIGWRIYAGRAIPFSSAERFDVTGKHWEILDSRRTVYAQTYATDCNLTSW